MKTVTNVNEMDILRSVGINRGPSIDEVLAQIRRLEDLRLDVELHRGAARLINETKETNDLQQLVDGIKVSIKNIIDKERVVIKCHFDIKNIFSIRSYLYSIFYNLILNSIKYRQCGVSPVIVIKSTFHENKIQLSFTDNGKGIDLENHGKQLFRLYKRFDTTVEGKGLGLFMVKTQVESLGGTVTVNSEVDKGTQFIIQLPVN